MAKKFELPEEATYQEVSVTKEERTYSSAKEEKEAKARKRGYALYRKYKLIYTYCCKPIGAILTYVFVSIVASPIRNTEFAKNYAAQFSERIGAASGAGPTSGIIINMIAIVSVILWIIISRTSKTFKYARELEKKSKA